LTSEVLAWPIFMADLNAWKAIWRITTFLYPIERTIIALASTFIGASLLRVLRSTNLFQTFNHAGSQEKCP
jgi:hypothetical protein